MSVPTYAYAYAANNPLRYTDPNGRELKVNPFMQWLYGDHVVAELERVIKMVQDPECRCALTKGGGYEKAPWDDRDIYIGVDTALDFTPFDGMSSPVAGVIWLSPDLYAEGAEAMANTIGHEAGHFRFPYWGHWPFAKERFDTPIAHCGIKPRLDDCPCD